MMCSSHPWESSDFLASSSNLASIVNMLILSSGSLSFWRAQWSTGISWLRNSPITGPINTQKHIFKEYKGTYKWNHAKSIEDKRPVFLFTCLVSSFEANFMLAGSKLGLGTAGKGMESCQCVKPIRHLTFSTDQRAQDINFWLKYFHFHSMST